MMQGTDVGEDAPPFAWLVEEPTLKPPRGAETRLQTSIWELAVSAPSA